MLLAAARDLMIVFLGIELMSVAVYVLAGLNRRSEKSAEGALKYFLLGAFSTGFLLYGIALVYGATGSTNLHEIGRGIGAGAALRARMLLIGIALLLVGFGFKVAVVPFHMWAPDVYEGADAHHGVHGGGGEGGGVRRLPARLARGLAGHGRRVVCARLVAGGGRDVRGQHRGARATQPEAAARLFEHRARRLLLVAVAVGHRWRSSAFLFYLLAYTLATFGAFAGDHRGARGRART